MKDQPPPLESMAGAFLFGAWGGRTPIGYSRERWQPNVGADPLTAYRLPLVGTDSRSQDALLGRKESSSRRHCIDRVSDRNSLYQSCFRRNKSKRQRPGLDNLLLHDDTNGCTTAQLSPPGDSIEWTWSDNRIRGWWQVWRSVTQRDRSEVGVGLTSSKLPVYCLTIWIVWRRGAADSVWNQ
jgi:hypothetical protein